MKTPRDFLTESRLYLKKLKTKIRQRVTQSWEEIMKLGLVKKSSTAHYKSKLDSLYKRIDKAVEAADDVLIAQLREELNYLNKDYNEKAFKRNSFF